MNPVGGQYSISFVVLVLLLGLFIGAAAGSLAENLTGVALLNNVIYQPFLIAKDFYILKHLEVQFTPASLMGLIAALLFLYFKR